MSVPISDIIQVNIAVSPNAVATDGYGPIVFLSKEFVPTVGEAYPVRQYTSLAAVSADFPSGEINKAATAWYSQKPTPKTFLVGAITNETVVPATPATLTAITAAVLATIKLETAAVMSLDINGTVKSTAAMDFSTAADLDAVVTQINAAFVAASMDVVISQTTGKFQSVYHCDWC